ncbi:MAG TPA: flagellar motor protein MotB [Jatrophihabitans sp.]|jgi:chemotaxis protein MotB|uniref:flagellar motor protein MotB n=1 Tax=Jatrophihabitans sp. TaxID=1932789 RepID=UPI002F1536B0
MSAGRSAAGRRRGGHAEEHENHERWMVTYADMLTLLLVLFIVLYAISQVNTSKFSELKSSLASAFKNGQPSVLSGGSGIVGGDSAAQQANPNLPVFSPIQPGKAKETSQDQEAARHEVDEFKEIEAAIRASLHKHGLDGNAEFSIDERGLVVTVVTNELVFSGNSAVLEPEGAVILNAVLPPLRKATNQIQVDGHTNQQNVSTAPYPSGWELSSARASSVVRYLVTHGPIAASRLSAAGFSDQRPLLAASDPRSITRNRRVDIVVLSKLPAAARSQLPTLGKGVGHG